MGEDEWSLVERVRAGDEAAVVELVDRFGAGMHRVAATYAGSNASVAEDIVQETWFALLEGLDRFEGRCSLKTWTFRILGYVAQRRLRSERRSMPFSALGSQESSVDPDRFFGESDELPGHWRSSPPSWDDQPERMAMSSEAGGLIADAIGRLPARQREVVTLRDVEGLSSDEVCELLRISEVNQRVLLHRARSKLRSTLEGYFERS